MATTSLWRIKGAIGDVIRYAENEKKTTKEILPEEKAREPTGSGTKSESSLDQLIAYASREEATNQRQLVTGIRRLGEVPFGYKGKDRRIHQMPGRPEEPAEKRGEKK